MEEIYLAKQYGIKVIIQERLDKAIVSTNYVLDHPKALVQQLCKEKLDNTKILIIIGGRKVCTRKSFVKAWASY